MKEVSKEYPQVMMEIRRIVENGDGFYQHWFYKGIEIHNGEVGIAWENGPWDWEDK